MSHHLFRAIEYLQIKKANGVSQEHRTSVIAHANLSREDMTTLRDSINTLLAEDT
jgi:hypothetical protein